MLYIKILTNILVKYVLSQYMNIYDKQRNMKIHCKQIQIFELQK